MAFQGVDLVYYTGTGSTALVANVFHKIFSEKGISLNRHQLRHNAMAYEPSGDLLLVVFPVHACNAPELIYRWIEGINHRNQVPVAVISVSGGDDITPNTACRMSTIKKLKHKGYNLIYEDMIVMPSNWIIATPMPVAKKLLTVLPLKVTQIVDAILSRKHQPTKPHLLDRMLSGIGELEKWGARSFGAHLRVEESCTSCGWCARACPSGNISCLNGPPTFGNQCQLCLCCVYGCPQKSLVPTRARFIIIAEGYSIRAVADNTDVCSEEMLDTLTKGFLWSGVKKYLGMF